MTRNDEVSFLFLPFRLISLVMALQFVSFFSSIADQIIGRLNSVVHVHS